MNGKDAIYHLAGIVGFPACEQNKELAEDVNVTGKYIFITDRNFQIQESFFVSTLRQTFLWKKIFLHFETYPLLAKSQATISSKFPL